MYILFIILKDETLIRKLVSILIELGLFDATVIEGEGVENLAARTIPLFSSLQGLFGEKFVYHKTVITPVDDRKTIDRLIELCVFQGIDFEQGKAGTLLAVPCEVCIPGEPR